MNLLSLFAYSIYAAETIISPIPDGYTPAPANVIRPDVTFGQISEYRIPVASTGSVIPEEITPSPTPAAIQKQKRAGKDHYTIAVLGDSMVDTLGPGIPDLQSKLTALFPKVTFNILNYGAGGTNIESGLSRLTSDYTYLGQEFPSLVSQTPDIVVVESFGYNPLPNETSLDRHWLDLAHIVDVIKANLPMAKIVIAATIAPDNRTFGDGAPGVAFDPQGKINNTTVIKKYLDNTVKFALSQRLPLADAYHASLDSAGNGLLKYINGGDHIHYSGAGRALFTQKVADAIVSNGLLE